MKTTLLITTYNRPAYLKRCLDSVKRAGIKDVLIVDDCSSDPETLRLLQDWPYKSKPVRKGICDSLLFGIQAAFDMGYDIVINLDADAIIRNDFLERMMELHQAFPNDIITGFHSTTKNADGSERHEILHKDFFDISECGIVNDEIIIDEPKTVNYCIKRSVGGINMLWTRETWSRYKPVIEEAQRTQRNWDHEVSKASGGIICAVPSLVQHIGIESAMGHHGTPDVADDFKTLSLPNVTLVCVDDDLRRGMVAVNKCRSQIEFGDIKMLSNEAELPFPYQHKITKLGSKEAYSKFIIQELHKYINTEFALIVQHDGYVKNTEAWLPEFMQYDYIGATWWYKDGMNVGNGGFSLRSKKLLQMTSKLEWKETHPEDHVICRTYRKQLETQGIKFAPDELADKFSFEGYSKTGTWNGQFGFHGSRAFRKPPDPKKTGFIINQFLGLGDILYLVPLIRHWMELGHDVIWPIADEYFDIKRHFPDIQFCKKSDWPRVPYEVPHETMHRWQYGVYQVNPLRWNRSLRHEDAMTTKYTMYGLDANMWRSLTWERDYSRESALKELLQIEGDYVFISQEYGNVTDGGAAAKLIEVPDGLQKVYSSRLDGFTLLDWSGIIENAKEIHAVSSSCIYLFETLQLKAEQIHLYSRRLGQRDFDMVRPILSKNYKFHV